MGLTEGEHSRSYIDNSDSQAESRQGLSSG